MSELVTYDMLIDGAWVQAGNGATFDSFDPSTGQVWSRAPEATAEDVDRAVRAADAALGRTMGRADGHRAGQVPEPPG